MRRFAPPTWPGLTWPLLAALLLGVSALALGPAGADEKGALTTEQIEADLRVEAALISEPKVRPGDPVQLRAALENASKERTHKVIEPGNGCAYGIVEPLVSYSATFTPVDGKPRELTGPKFSGMCGMGDYRWHSRVRDLAPGESFDIGARLSYASASMDMSKPGRYDVRVHYMFRRRGTTEKLPQADPVGDLGPMESSPKFEIVSEPVPVHVVRPLEVFVEPRGTLGKVGGKCRMSDVVHVRIENWGDKLLRIDAKKLMPRIETRWDGGEAVVTRTPIAVKGGFKSVSIKPVSGVYLVGPGGIRDEAWTVLTDGPLEIAVSIGGFNTGLPTVRSQWVRLGGPPAK